MSYQVAENILKAHRGTRFIKADLHIHTPASKDWDEKNPESQYHSSKITPKQIVDAAIAEELDLISITDHNSVEWCEKIIKAAEGTLLTVLPGFELTVDPGVHILAIFPEKKSIVELQDLLISPGIERDKFGDAAARTNSSITGQDSDYKVVREIEDAEGLVIPAHIDNDAGLIGRLKGGNSVKDFLAKSRCRILEITKDSPPQIVSDLLKNNPRQFALINNSDAHRLDGIGKKHTWLKLDSMSLTSLRQIGFEPLNRVQRSLSDPSKKAKIIGMYSDGGFLEGQVFAFNEDLNCIIGGRGAGKSLILDYLRFVFNDEPEADELRQNYYKRLVDLVYHSTKVYVLVEDSNDDLWLYERTLTFENEKKRGKETYKITSNQASVYQVFRDRGEVIKFGDEIKDFSIDFYSQGEVQSITNQAESSRQLKLVDNFIRVNLVAREEKVDEFQENLNDLETKITNIDTELDSLSTDIDQLEKIEARIAEIEASQNDEQWKTHEVWENANIWASSAITHLNKQQEHLNSMKFEILDKRVFDLSDKQSSEILGNFLIKVEELLILLTKAETELKKQVNDSRQEIEKIKTQWDTKFTEQKKLFTEFLKSQGVPNLAVLSRELAETKSRRDQIKKEKIPRCDELKAQRTSLLSERQKRIKNLYDTWEAISECRKQAAKVMTKRLGREIKIEISQHREVGEFYDTLKDIVPPGTHKDVINTIVNSFSPMQLTKLIREKNEGDLRKSGISTNAVERLLKISPADLMKLERVSCDDIAVIQLKLEGVYRNLDALSNGEKCTAILSIILLDENRPLVIDQPEDELDHDFIMSNIVHTLAQVKQKNDVIAKDFSPRTGRQFIIATHNQNIPVLGDAELVIRMKKIPEQNKCNPVTAYGIDNSETIHQVLSLEGGKEAFDRRGEKYLSYNM